MDSNLRHLQELGIDVWVTRERAEELHAKGVARPIQIVRSDVSPSARKQRSERRSTTRRELSPGRSRPDFQENTSRSPESISKQADRPKLQIKESFSVELKFYMRGSVGMLMDESMSYSDKFIEDILRAFYPLNEHTFNELKFEFPHAPKSNQPRKTEGDLAGAQQVIVAWVAKRFEEAATLCVVGEKARAVCAKLGESNRIIELNDLPTDIEAKKDLWHKIQQNLN